MLELLADPHTWFAFATLTALELVLGIDNVIFISILVDKLPPRSARACAQGRSVCRNVHAAWFAFDAELDCRYDLTIVRRTGE